MSSFTNPHVATWDSSAKSAPILLEANVQFVTPDLEAVAALWREKCAGRRYPARADFSMRDLKLVLRNLAFLEPTSVADGYRFLVRFMGSELDAQLMPMTGRYADQVLPEYFKRKWQAVWSHPITTGSLVRSLARAEFRPRQYSYAEGFYAPLSDDGVGINMVMAVVYYHEIDAQNVKSRKIAEQLRAQYDDSGAAGKVVVV